MSNYTQVVSYGPKDALTLGDANKFIKGAQFDAEFQAISTAVATKIDSAFSAPTVTNLNVTSTSVPTNGIYNPGAALGLSSSSVARVLIDGNGVFQVFTPTGTASGSVSQPNPALLLQGPLWTKSGGVSTTTSVAATLFTMSNVSATHQAWLVAASMPASDDAVHYSDAAIVFANTATSTIVHLTPSSNFLSLSLSGLAVQATQASGNNGQLVWYTALRLM